MSWYAVWQAVRLGISFFVTIFDELRFVGGFQALLLQDYLWKPANKETK
jgi:hypothetical protein